ncbi:MAG: FAD-dependent oxidoreductase [Saprospiraceae bacterium]|nr:FAD-dependent oxidoreductase [Saprospiraceae bacterium]
MMSDAPDAYDFFIVGQGLAGTLIAHFLEERGQQVCVWDAGSDGSASQVAAGLINPVTGRRYVKSWRIDDLLPVARTTYRRLEQKLGLSLIRERNILRALFSRKDENDWWARSADPAYRKYLVEQPDLGAYRDAVVPAHNYGEVTHSLQIDLPKLLLGYRNYLRERNQFREARFDYKQIKMGDGGVLAANVRAKCLVFCEGYGLKHNPYFNHLPLSGMKGEALTARLEGFHPEKILKQRLFLVPLEEELFWIGATYDRHFSDARPTEAGRIYLENRLRKLITMPFRIVGHQAAVRPTVRDRRPLLGRHPEFPRLVVFNGLGTKGASLGPFWAKHLVNHLLEGMKLDEEVDLSRYSA